VAEGEEGDNRIDWPNQGTFDSEGGTMYYPTVTISTNQDCPRQMGMLSRKEQRQPREDWNALPRACRGHATSMMDIPVTTWVTINE
jgi:hypothetical protein